MADMPIINRLKGLERLQDPDYGLETEELILSRGFQVENHYLVTKSGYIMHVYRIIHPIMKPHERKKPILLWHTVCTSSKFFLINSPGGNFDDPKGKFVGNNMGFELARYGYDVWLINSRGNFYSKNHSFLDPDKDYVRYWNFSMDEIIEEDGPLAVDYILEKTNKTKLGFIGWSTGSTIGLCMLAQHPRFNDIIEPFIALGPTMSFGGTYPNFFWHMNWFAKLHYNMRGDGNHLPDKLLPPYGIDIVCAVWPEVCAFTLDMMAGGNANYNMSRMHIYTDFGSLSISEKHLRDWTQQYMSGKTIRKFDYGPDENLKRYGSKEAPVYPLQDITSRAIYVFWSTRDGKSGPHDLDMLRSTLKVPFTEFHMKEPKWSHLDYVWGRQARMLINTPIIEILNNIDIMGDETFPRKWTRIELGSDTVLPLY